jgi:hypothetical protein
MGGLDTATSGFVSYRGKDLTKATEKELTEYRRFHVGFVFQFYNLISSLTAKENVTVVTEIASNPMRPEDALALVGLTDRLNHFPAQLSGGEQQRVAIARAISKNPAVLLCDEPTGALILFLTIGAIIEPKIPNSCFIKVAAELPRWRGERPKSISARGVEIGASIRTFSRVIFSSALSDEIFASPYFKSSLAASSLDGRFSRYE